MKKEDIDRLSHIKNVSNHKEWAYKENPVSSYFLLHFHRAEDSAAVDSHALNLPKGSLIILSQKPPREERYLTHVVELVNDGIEDQPLWEIDRWKSDPYGIVRWVKVLWAATNFDDLSTIPVDSEVLKADWNWQNTQAKLLENSQDLKKKWGDINSLRTHLASVFN